MQLGREPNAQVTFSSLTDGAQVTPVFVPGVGGDQGSHADSIVVGADSKDYVFHFNGSVSGTAIVATYTNLNNSYYTEPSTGQHKKIAKIVRQFSNLSKSSAPLQYNSALNANKGQWDLSGFNHGNPSLVIYSDPSDGFWYNRSDGVSVTEQYYDDSGNLINIMPNSGYIAITSLNNKADSYDPSFPKFSLNNAHIEKVTAVSGGSALALLGSSVSNHNGTLYSDKNNSDGPANTLNDISSWDKRGGTNEYYGTGLVSLTGASHTIRFSCQQDPNHSIDVVWVTMTTIIPQTPEPTYTGPEKPTPKVSSKHYHYDVCRLFNEKSNNKRSFLNN